MARLVGSLILALALLMAGRAAATPTGTNQVQVQNFAFAPSPLVVTVGDTVRWTNHDNAPHTATPSVGQSWTTEISLPTHGATGAFTFTQAGSFSYACRIHPSMTATIQVEPTPAAGVVDSPISTFAFSPTVTISAGQRVRWINNDSATHAILSAAAAWPEFRLELGDAYGVTFAAAGSYPYSCSLHPFMNGTIEVRAPGAELPPRGFVPLAQS